MFLYFRFYFDELTSSKILSNISGSRQRWERFLNVVSQTSFETETTLINVDEHVKQTKVLKANLRKQNGDENF